MKAKTEEVLIIFLVFILLIATFFFLKPTNLGFVIYEPQDYTYDSSITNEDGYKLVKQDIQNLQVTNLNPSNYETAFLQVGNKYYIDRGYKIESIPEDLQNLLWIKTANDNKNTQNLNFNFDVNSPVRVYIAYDKRISVPSWLSSWTYYGDGIETKDTSAQPYKIYYKNFEQGNIVLGDNCEEDCDGSEKSMYLVLINTIYPSSASLISEDIEPENLSSWDLLEKEETLNEQTITYGYSIDSGSTWNEITEFNLSNVDSSKIKFKITLNSDGLDTPVLLSLSINYIEEICIESWSCNDWGDCIDNTQQRICTDSNSCGTILQKPSEVQNCTIECTEDWTCTNWSECINETQTRTCTDINNCNTTENIPEEIQNCTGESCVENWTCSDWSECINETQTKTCTDLNNCDTILEKPIETQNCTIEEEEESESSGGGGGSSSGSADRRQVNTINEQALQKVTVPVKLESVEVKKPRTEPPKITGSVIKITKYPDYRLYINTGLLIMLIISCFVCYKYYK